MTDKITFALAIPTTADWRPERAASLGRLKSELGSLAPELRSYGGANHEPTGGYKEFRDKAPNWVWSRELWKWAASTDATHLLQLQDDIRPMPEFWPVLRAMVEANPHRWIGLQVNHPIARSLAHYGRRWFATQAWLVGCQYVAPLTGPDSLSEFLTWLEKNEPNLSKQQREHEDVTISTWLASTKRALYHPIPAIADVDLSIGSTYEGVDGHIDDHRRPVVTWQGYDPAMLKDPLFWELPSQIELVRGPDHGVCVVCNERPAQTRTRNLIAFCAPCLLDQVATSWGIQLGVTTKKVGA
jgi:hypothetical protein